MRNFWHHLRLPTLVRRMLVAQMLLLTLLWCLFLTFILLEDLRSPPILTGSETYETLFSLVESMDDRPQARDAVLAAFSKALREGYGGGEDPELAESLARQSVALRPEYRNGWLVLSRALEVQGRLSDAREALLKAGEL